MSNTNNTECISTDFYVRRLHSLLGIVPIGFFLLEHIITISQVMGGGHAFDAAVAKLAAIPHDILITLEIVFIAIPLLIHGIYGAYIAMQAKTNMGRYGYMRNRQFTFQRWTAWYLIVFLIWHVGYLRFMVKGSEGISFAQMSSYLDNPIVFVLYVIGLVAAIFHFTNGLFTFSITWGIAKGPRVQGVINKIAWVLFVVLSIVGIMSMFAFRA
ncbi:MAG: succinate dehydrogenase [Selenomonadales bacterium]|nr:succinate dehydrogenase [Selenomonadales bacterium]